ncbi:MAG: acetoacetate--CoA ligase [Paraburkholderia sp.]|uniref:acetoacetate--CoA ligase n=1 Tax=Paraburkholderia sp. TaxID=1926495 RepID=UPI001225AA3B|nr:acetoacetate--CoA ligase [Paraburkholderia sp.]TAM03962.1 MAG: acetoacetate--CoA ligase [Paraburkholderia sp.]TAM31945.1 MAG: acetoacetate--CoA ligase [Paraburkholderia sp.]
MTNQHDLTDHHAPADGPVYVPPAERIAASQLTAFAAALRAHTGEALKDYHALHAFSVRDYRTFWRFFIDWVPALNYAGDPDPVCVGDACEQAVFFPDIELNYADNLLSFDVAPATAPAITACHADGSRTRLTRGELRERVERLAAALERFGLRSGDRVVAVMRNDENAVVTALAVTALGAILSTASPEMGTEALLERFGQLSPRLLFAHTAPLPFDTGVALIDKVAAIAASTVTLEAVVSVDDGPLPQGITQATWTSSRLAASADAGGFAWRRFPFNHPLFIMFSSGTTGKPKCIVHGAGGALLEHLKEHRLHSDLVSGDKMYFHTSCAWMMWNWQLSALASGVEIVTYDGPLAGVDTLWRLVSEEHVTVFGTSPAYLKMCAESGLEPGRKFDLRALRAMMSTGAVLFDSQFRWVHDHVKPLQLQSISGGTDILGCFVLGNPNLPVHAGEAQCRSLALDVQAWDGNGPAQGRGELVCTNPFPSRPLGFFGDADGSRFHAAYFAANPGMWTHGDQLEFSSQGGAHMHGRSDGVLNVRGINVGPGEIYRVLSDIPGILESMVVEQRVAPRRTAAASCAMPAMSIQADTDDAFDKRVVLLVVLERGITLNSTLIADIRRQLGRRASPAHVPDVVLQVDALPVTHSGKPSEAAVRNAVNGLPVGNTAALRNPECLDAIRRHPAFNVTKRELPPVGETLEQFERYLQAVWEHLFDFGPIGRDDNFFDIGGDSLMAAAMIAQVQDATPCSISLATLIAAPTIARFAATIRESDRAPDRSNDIVVPIRAGVGSPVYWVHSMAGSVMECLKVINELRSERPLYGLHARGLDGREAPQSSVVDMASHYVDEIRRVQTHGPYAIIGFSFGGLVALEMAQQLHRAGEQIELLCILDTYVHERCLPFPDWLRYQSVYMRRQWKAWCDVPPVERAQFISRKLSGAVDKIRLRLGHMARNPTPEVLSLPPAVQRMREAMRVAMATYRPKAYDAGPIHYVRAAHPIIDRASPMPLWQHIARHGLNVTRFGSGHYDMVLEPYVEPLARTLDQMLTGNSRSATTRPERGGTTSEGRYAL